MDSCNTWQCYNSFAPWLSAIGTITISALALWLSMRDKVVRLEGYFSKVIISSNGNKSSQFEGYALVFVNIGTRDVEVTSYIWQSRSMLLKKQRALITSHLSSGVSHLSSKFPCRLKDGQSGKLVFERDFIEALETSESFIFKRNPLNAFFHVFTSTIILTTSVGKKIKVKIPFDSKLTFWKSYCRWRKPKA